MEDNYTIPLSRIIEEFSLETVHLPDLPENILISNKHVNRPGLSLIGFYDHFEQTRVELIGKAEYLYLKQLNQNIQADTDIETRVKNNKTPRHLFCTARTETHKTR